MIQEYQIRILPEQAASEEGIKRYLAKEKGLDVRTLNQVRVLKRSIDARPVSYTHLTLPTTNL